MMQKLTYKAQLSQNRLLTGAATPCLPFVCCHVQGGYVMPYMVDDQGFVAVRANSSHLVMHYYASSHQQPVYTAVLAHAG
jgi:hypothetical protein